MAINIKNTELIKKNPHKKTEKNKWLFTIINIIQYFILWIRY
jgi:hypothetical protein